MIKVLFALLALTVTPLLGHAYTRRPFIIAVAGGSASGKTHNARLLVEALGHDRAELISADNYYAPHKQDPAFYFEGNINYDHPTAVDLQKLAWHLSYLRSGFSVQVPEYTYGRKVEVEKLITHHPKEFIVVEGIFVLYPEIANLVDYRVFVNVPREQRLERRLRRDWKERQIAPEVVQSYFDRVVEPMHRQFIQPSSLLADQIIRSPDDPETVAKIVAAVREQADEMRAVKSSVMLDTYDRTMREVRDARPLDFSIMPIDKLHPSQEDLGFLALSYKSDLVDTLVRETALRPERPSTLRPYLENNSIPVAMINGRPVIADHHHLIAALVAKGIREVLTTSVDASTIDPARVEWVRRQKNFVKVSDLRNNPFRSLATIVRDLGYVKKTGRHHEEFEWATYYAIHLRKDHDILVTEEMLLDVDQRKIIVDHAIALAQDERAKDLPGFTPKECQALLR